MEARSSSLKKRARDSSVDELKPSPTVIKCFSDLVPLIKTLREDDDESCFKSTNTESIPKSATFSEPFLPSCRLSVDESTIDIDTQQVEFLEDGWVDKLLSSIFQEDCLSDDFHCMDREDIPPTTIECVKEINEIDSQVPVSESFYLYHDVRCSLQVALCNKIGKARAGSTASISNQKTKMGEAEKDMSMHRTNMTTLVSSHSAQASSTNETGAGQVQICVPHRAAMFPSFSRFPIQHLPSVQQCDVLTPETRERIALWHFFELAERMDVPMYV